MPAKRSTIDCRRCGRTLPRHAYAELPRHDGPYTRPDRLCRDCRIAFDAAREEHRRHPNTAFLCACGCGRPTNLAPKTDPAKGWIAGKPMRFIRGHNMRSTPYPPLPYVVDPATGCWVWQLKLGKGGYARISRDGRNQSASRLYYEAKYGPVPDGLVMDHRCPHGPNRACVNPDHLVPTTVTENSRYRQNTKIGMDQARAIRALADRMSQNALAKWFGISPTHVAKIIKGYAWVDD